ATGMPMMNIITASIRGTLSLRGFRRAIPNQRFGCLFGFTFLIPAFESKESGSEPANHVYEEERHMRLALTAFMVTAALFARADDSAVRKALSDRYARYDKATLHGIEPLAKWCEEYFAPDCTIQAGGKTMTGKQF